MRSRFAVLCFQGGGAFHFADGASQGTEYGYDDNGNMTMDLNRGMPGITYNSLNLPTMMLFDDGGYISCTYDGAGNKLRTQYGVQAGIGPLTAGNAGQDNDGTEGREAPGSLPTPDEMNRTDYCGNVVYDRGERRLLLGNGYVAFDPQTGIPSYHFFLRDGIEYIKEQLSLSKPLVIGVSTGVKHNNNNPNTGHFLNIVGMGFDKNVNYFSYYDNATSDISKGTNLHNNRMRFGLMNGTGGQILYDSSNPGGRENMQYIISDNT